MRRIFRDASHQAQFERDGFVQLPLLAPAEVAQLREHYLGITAGKSIANSVYGVAVSLHAQDAAERRSTMEAIKSVVLPRADAFLCDWQLHMAGYWTKQPDASSYVVPHQDWTFTDDERLGEDFWLSVWIALGDYGPDQGSLGFVKGSHRFFDDLICSPSRVAGSPTQGHERLLFQYVEFPRLRAGDALAFTTRTIHASLPNRGAEPRLAVGIAATPSGTELYHYYLAPGRVDRALKLKIGEAFLVEYTDDAKLHALWEAGRLPEHGSVVAELAREPRQLSAQQLEACCIRHGNTRKQVEVSFPWESPAAAVAGGA